MPVGIGLCLYDKIISHQSTRGNNYSYQDFIMSSIWRCILGSNDPSSPLLSTACDAVEQTSKWYFLYEQMQTSCTILFSIII